MEPVVDLDVVIALIKNVSFDERVIPVQLFGIIKDPFVRSCIILEPVDIGIEKKLFEKLGEFLALIRRSGLSRGGPALFWPFPRS